MARNDIKLFKDAMSLIHKDALKKDQKKVALVSGGGAGHEYVVRVHFLDNSIANLQLIVTDLHMEATLVEEAWML
jgi:hypothetical protein